MKITSKRSTLFYFYRSEKLKSSMRAIALIRSIALKRVIMWAYNHGWLSLSLTQWLFDKLSIHSA